MRVSLRRRVFVACAVVAGVIGACEHAQDPGGSIPAPSDLSADAVGMTTVRLSWRPTEGEEVASYEIQRRPDLHGTFVTIAEGVPADGADRTAYFDTDVDPDRYYGYRVRAVSPLGARSAASNIAGTKTAPEPGLRIQTSTQFPNAESADRDGYTAVIRGASDTNSVSLALNAQRLISPIDRGTYSIVLRGLAINCSMVNAGDTVQSAAITDEGIHTVAGITFSVSCRDPRKASIVAVLQTTGDTLDADGVTITASGIIREAGTPANERVYFDTKQLTGANGSVRFDNLRPGDYEITMADIDAPCAVNGTRKKELQPAALAVDTVRFAITCRKVIVVDTVGRPFILRQTWSSATARAGDKVSLLTSLDLRAQPTQQAAGVAATITFDHTVVRRDSARTTGTFDLTSAALAPGQQNIIALSAGNIDGTGRSGDIQIVRTWFTVIGAAGSSVRTSTTVGEVLTPPPLVRFDNKVSAEDNTLTITSGGGTANQLPVATITAPATATVGTPVAFSGAQSTDSDGTIASYAWNFGDNSSGSGVSASHTYAAAGTFTVRLTVTDDRGGTGTRDHTIVVSEGAPTTGTISGTVTSPQQGALAGVTLAVTGGPTATTNATGGYSIASVATGSRTVSVSTLPTGCTTPAPQTVTVTAGATATANFQVTCPASPTTGTITGKVMRADGSGVANVQVVVLPAGGTALAAVSTIADGTYSVANIPIGSGGTAGTGSITLSSLPSGCTSTAENYTGLLAGQSIVKNISIACSAPTTGSITGTITRSTGGGLSGVQVVATPSAGGPLPGVTTPASGAYTIVGVPVGAGTLSLTGLPAGCTNPGAQNYSGVAAGGPPVTVNIVVTCAAAPHTYPFTSAWGPITTTGPTGRQVTLTLSIDMGAAPGRPDIAGAAADPLAGISLNVLYDGTKLDWLSRSLLSPDEFDLVVVNESGQGTAAAQTAVAVGSTSGATKTGNIQLVRLTFNIATGVSGTITPVINITEALATSGLTNVTASVVVLAPPSLIIP